MRRFRVSKAMHVRFQNRIKAGKFLAGRLVRYTGRTDVIVLGLPRGGVPVAAGIATALGVALDALAVGKPGPTKVADARSGGASRVLSHPAIDSVQVSATDRSRAPATEPGDPARREQPVREARPAAAVRGRTVILVDDGIATGATMRAAVESTRRNGARYIVVAAPVAARESYLELRQLCDELIVVMAPRELGRLGEYYADFSPATDHEIREMLAGAQLQHLPG